MDNICLECHNMFKKESGLHIHIRSHGMTLKDYYHKHFPRYDKYTKELISFKDKEFYFSSDFNDRHSLKSWLNSANESEVKVYVQEFWVKRKRRKNLIWAPTQIEIRSLSMPGKRYLNKLFGDYNTFFNAIGLKQRFFQESFIKSVRDISKFTVIIDTREQKPLEFNNKTKEAALPFGDYRLSNNSVSGHCYIERKSIMDFHGTVCKGFERFSREVARALAAGAYLIVVVEGTLEDLYQFANSPFFNKPLSESNQKITITSTISVLGKMRDLIQQYTNLQFIFVENRENASKVIERLFQSGGEFNKIDLQYAYDTGKFFNNTDNETL